MANPARGEVGLRTDRGELTMRLTLGALAALEARLGAEGLVGLAERFEAGRCGADDLIALLTAGLRGGGLDISEEEVAALGFEGGAVGAAQAAAALLERTFGGPS